MTDLVNQLRRESTGVDLEALLRVTTERIHELDRISLRLEGELSTVSSGISGLRESAEYLSASLRHHDESAGMRAIFSRIAADHGLSIDDMRSDSRVREIAWARQDGMLECKDAGFTVVQIAHFLHRDHTTICYGIQAAKARSAKRFMARSR